MKKVNLGPIINFFINSNNSLVIFFWNFGNILIIHLYNFLLTSIDFLNTLYVQYYILLYTSSTSSELRTIMITFTD